MGTPSEIQVDAQVRALCGKGSYDEATTLALRAHGNEVLRFLCALVKNEGDASEVFSIFTEDLWRSFEGFSWECSLRTWAYMLARRASSRMMRLKWRKKLVLGSSPAIANLVQEIRTATLTYLRTETKTRLRALRDALDEEDQVLLMLRVDRGLAWEELARVFAEKDANAEALKRESARLRKRFQLVKERLKALAKQEGLYEPRERDG
jgi:RNA polymerase sigma-70 factor, ECF subfamily